MLNNNRFTCLVKSNPLKQEVTRTVILPLRVSILCLQFICSPFNKIKSIWRSSDVQTNPENFKNKNMTTQKFPLNVTNRIRNFCFWGFFNEISPDSRSKFILFSPHRIPGKCSNSFCFKTLESWLRREVNNLFFAENPTSRIISIVCLQSMYDTAFLDAEFFCLV